MAQATKVVHVDEVPIGRMQERDGWAISEFRLPISGADGSATTLFHAIFRGGSTHAKHVHKKCDELVAYLAGHGVVGQGEDRAEVSPGHRRLIPQGTQHFFHNETEEQEALVVGFYVGAGSLAQSGYEHRGPVQDTDVRRPLSGITEGVLVRFDEATMPDVSVFEGWQEAKVWLSIGTHMGSNSAMLDVQLVPGAAIGPHRMDRCQQLYFIVSGNGVVASVGQATCVRKGHAIFVPEASTFAVRNVGTREPLWMVGVLTGAGDFTQAGLTSA